MDIPGLGPVTLDPSLGWYCSDPLPVPVLGGAHSFAVDGYDDDPERADFHAAIAAFLALDRSALAAAGPSAFEYYRDVMADEDPPEEELDRYPQIAGPGDVWEHVRPGDEVLVKRRRHGDRRVYVSVDCGCGWEDEHGMQIVFRDGREVTKVGPHDGHLSNADSFARADLESVVYVRPWALG